VRIGSSVRGAIDLAAIAERLTEMRGVPADDWQAGLDAALVSLSGRIRMHESAGRRPEEIVRELYEAVFGAPPSSERDGSDPGEA
jgi:MoxR-like ATPase